MFLKNIVLIGACCLTKTQLGAVKPCNVAASLFCAVIVIVHFICVVFVQGNKDVWKKDVIQIEINN